MAVRRPLPRAPRGAVRPAAAGGRLPARRAGRGLEGAVTVTLVVLPYRRQPYASSRRPTRAEVTVQALTRPSATAAGRGRRGRGEGHARAHRRRGGLARGRALRDLHGQGLGQQGQESVLTSTPRSGRCRGQPRRLVGLPHKVETDGWLAAGTTQLFRCGRRGQPGGEAWSSGLQVVFDLEGGTAIGAPRPHSCAFSPAPPIAAAPEQARAQGRLEAGGACGAAGEAAQSPEKLRKAARSGRRGAP